MRSNAAIVDDYLASLPEERRAALAAIRSVILENLPEGYVEAMNWGMISYEIPLAASGKTYNGQPLMIAALASQKRHMALYLCGLYASPEIEKSFVEKVRAGGRKLDMGKACVRFRNLADLDLDAVAGVIAAVPVADYVELARTARERGAKKRGA